MVQIPKKGGNKMADLRYNRTFKQGIIGILFCFLLFGSMVGFFIASKIQYNNLVANMNPTEATIIDIDWDMHIKGPDEQEIFIEYEVDGIRYSRELKTDTKISFAAGSGAHYSIGDKIQIFYDPQNPEIIASPRSVGVGYVYMLIALFGLALVSFALIVVLKNRRQFLVTEEEYKKEKEELKRNKSAEKKQKACLKAERKKKYAKVRKIMKVVWIVFGTLVGAFILWLLFGLFLISIGY